MLKLKCLVTFRKTYDVSFFVSQQIFETKSATKFTTLHAKADDFETHKIAFTKSLNTTKNNC